MGSVADRPGVGDGGVGMGLGGPPPPGDSGDDSFQFGSGSVGLFPRRRALRGTRELFSMIDLNDIITTARGGVSSTEGTVSPDS